jgi:hypothetical protein
VDEIPAAWFLYRLAGHAASLAFSCASAFITAQCMPLADLRILDLPDKSSASRHHRNRIKRKNRRTRAQLLLVSSELEAAAVAELADRERSRFAAARLASDDRAAVLSLADRERIRAGCPVSAAPLPDSVDAKAVSDLAKRTLRESRDQTALERHVVARFDTGPWCAPSRRPSSPESPGRSSTVHRPAQEPPAGAPAAAPAPCPADHERLELENLALRRAIVLLEAEREEKRLRLLLLESSARLAQRAEATSVDLPLPSGPSAAHALAEKDARIAQLQFQLAERSDRQLQGSLGRVAAFVHNPSNCFALPPSAGTVAESSSPLSRGPSPLLGGCSPPPAPPPVGRRRHLFSWGLGLARGASSQDQRERSARSAGADAAPPAGARAPLPPA